MCDFFITISSVDFVTLLRDAISKRASFELSRWLLAGSTGLTGRDMHPPVTERKYAFSMLVSPAEMTRCARQVGDRCRLGGTKLTARANFQRFARTAQTA
jgi:hypothetical protein